MAVMFSVTKWSWEKGVGEREKATVRIREWVRGREDNRERQTTFRRNIVVESLPKVRATFYCCLCLASAVSFYVLNLWVRQIQSQPRCVRAQCSKTTLFEKLLVQSALFLSILWKLWEKNQQRQTERHYNSSATSYVLSFKVTRRLAITLHMASLSLQTDKAVKCLLSQGALTEKSRHWTRPQSFPVYSNPVSSWTEHRKCLKMKTPFCTGLLLPGDLIIAHDVWS